MRRLVALAVAALVGAAGLVVVTDPPEAQAHGAQVFPGSRQYFCWLDGTDQTGNIVPQNPACADAVAASGTTPLYNWFGNLDPAGAGRTTGYIPDGQICSGGDNGPYDFSPYNAMRDDWPRTHLTAGDTYQFQHNNWAHHPGHFDVYVTVEGWDPSAPLSWDDLELVHTENDPPQSGGPGGLEYYFWDITLPADRSGQHLIFTHWVRSDSPENFYSCSDVVFDGGNGEVVGIGDDPGPVDPQPEVCPDTAPGVPTPPMASSITDTSAHIMWGLAPGCVTGFDVLDSTTGDVVAATDGSPMIDLIDLEPETSYEVAVRSRNDHLGTTSALTDAVEFTTLATDSEPVDPPPAGDCEVDYSAQAWGAGQRGYTASVTITNSSDAPVNGWEVTFEYPGGQTVDVPGWGASLAQDGTAVTAVHPAWSSSIGAGQSVTFGFNGATATAGEHPAPSDFTLNGTACTS
ncbi:hypothetical protein GCM10009718_00920 [Isoptericola halotolerans]|uniref:Chitin-binding protein n=1 Tax=Isoptericola halotolerans TaxID=300560 RepID=A0ABX2A629_9MICO|nr:lytic polysaccharide monooxygenase [Isoptericola halotolerans]NOV98273.1 chitin-binding protein [Isoptericola halotolerans]